MTNEIMQPAIPMNESTQKSQEAMSQETWKALNQLLTELQQIDSHLYRRYLGYALTTLATTGFGLAAN